MRDVKSYIAPVKLGDTMRAAAVGVVLESLVPDKFKEGDFVQGMFGWCSHLVCKASKLTKLPSPSKLPPQIPITAFLGVLGGTGLTAYFGLLEVGKPKKGETVLVSGAAGAVGSIVGQIAKIKGARVVGIAGSDAKCRWLTEKLGFDAAVNYKTTRNLTRSIRKACPRGVDVFFDNVGGSTLDAALVNLRRRARVVVCGAISQYNAEGKVQGPSNYMMLLVQRARMEGFVIFDYKDRFPQAVRDLMGWIISGQIDFNEHVIEGIEQCPDALLKLFDGSNRGKMIVKFADAPRARL